MARAGHSAKAGSTTQPPARTKHGPSRAKVFLVMHGVEALAVSSLVLVVLGLVLSPPASVRTALVVMGAGGLFVALMRSELTGQIALGPTGITANLTEGYAAQIQQWLDDEELAIVPARREEQIQQAEPPPSAVPPAAGGGADDAGTWEPEPAEDGEPVTPAAPGASASGPDASDAIRRLAERMADHAVALTCLNCRQPLEGPSRFCPHCGFPRPVEPAV